MYLLFVQFAFTIIFMIEIVSLMTYSKGNSVVLIPGYNLLVMANSFSMDVFSYLGLVESVVAAAAARIGKKVLHIDK